MKGWEIFIPKMQEQSIMEMAIQTCTTGRVTIIGKGNGERLREPLWGDTEQVEDKGEYYLIRGGDH
jgi:FlaA1/EpsC-like NDP-sugar epimerase